MNLTAKKAHLVPSGFADRRIATACHRHEVGEVEEHSGGVNSAYQLDDCMNWAVVCSIVAGAPGPDDEIPKLPWKHRH